LHQSNSENVIWIYQNAFDYFSVYVRGNAFLNDIALIQSFVDKNESFKIKVGPNIGSISNKKIYYNISKLFNFYGLSNHSATIINVIDELEKQNNLLYPSLKELKYWENKSFMHYSFDKLNIPTPKTWIVSIPEDIDSFAFSILYPCLLKECNSSGSLGLHKASNEQELKELISQNNKLGKHEFLVQHLINMRRDLRVIFVDGEIVLHYWRINQSNTWKPTSTGHGSKVDFVSFPENWRKEILSISKKLGIRTGAFDIAWNNDDLNTSPLILEVSPSYMPNPIIPEKWSNMSLIMYWEKLHEKSISSTLSLKKDFEVNLKKY
jgi:glutathione synthase/RimK-type ligase-like ATP-grasp enzyme